MVHTFSAMLRYTMIVGRENTHPTDELLFTPCFLSFTFSFYPLFHFALVCALLPSPLGSRAFPFAPGSFSNRNKSFTGRSKSVHIWGGGMGYTKDVDKGSRNPEPTSLPIFYFSFTPLFQICVVNRQSAVASFPPTSGGALSAFRRKRTASGEKDFVSASRFVRTVPIRTRGCTAA